MYILKLKYLIWICETFNKDDDDDDDEDDEDDAEWIFYFVFQRKK